MPAGLREFSSERLKIFYAGLFFLGLPGLKGEPVFNISPPIY